MFAFVRFISDKVTKVVSVNDIKDFDENSYETDSFKIYEVFWKSPTGGSGTGFYYAIVLLIAETKELINDRKRRVKMPNDVKWEDLQYEVNKLMENKENNKDKDDESRQKNKEVQVKRSILEKGQLKGHIKKCKEMKPHRISISEFSEDDDIISKSEFKLLKEENKKVLQKLQLKEQENVALKKKNEKLLDLNLRLQEKMLSMFDNGSLRQKESTVVEINPEKPKTNYEGGLRQKESMVVEIKHGKPHTNDAEGDMRVVNEVEERDNTSKEGDLREKLTVANEIEGSTNIDKAGTSENANKLYLHYNEGLLKWKDGKMELAPKIFVSTDQWEKIIRGKSMNASKFTRNLAVSLWGTENLKGRSVTGEACRRFLRDGVEAKPALTPIKIDAVQNGLRYFLHDHQKMGEEQTLSLASAVSVRRMLTEKLMDITKTKKAVRKDSVNQ